MRGSFANNAMPLSISDENRYSDHTVSSCIVRETVATFWFSTPDKGKTRHFSADTERRTFTIGFSNGKGTVSWNDVASIILKEPDALEQGAGYVVMEFHRPRKFMTWKKHKRMEFGVISEECWDELKAFIGEGITMEEPLAEIA
uniref:Uncharacterized protein n=1 Tax=Candidatus Kentrum sp. MB TaxID=2138164 RepID=A0A450XMN5_9GAMM|nr:MAG: hypothetical protein BECKMB1821G_GA0114241_100738 [Candidatus Kentron sp. MB]VFK30527.1 MAG: hypothetical protein BECKMB1821I_GA0114274_101620 [Candidatus Kentron sp. MB]VFK75287.1 MAG: hypothetical protein BECKMB1821H_GA0114242_101919 [Candidatus Kentron sp. MB]